MHLIILKFKESCFNYMKYTSNIIAKIIKYNKLIHYSGIKKHKCKRFEKVIKEIENNETYNSVNCSKCYYLFGLIPKKK